MMCNFNNQILISKRVYDYSSDQNGFCFCQLQLFQLNQSISRSYIRSKCNIIGFFLLRLSNPSFVSYNLFSPLSSLFLLLHHSTVLFTFWYVYSFVPFLNESCLCLPKTVSCILHPFLNCLGMCTRTPESSTYTNIICSCTSCTQNLILKMQSCRIVYIQG